MYTLSINVTIKEAYEFLIRSQNDYKNKNRV